MNFLKNNKRFDFKYGEKSIWEYPYTANVTQEGNNLTTEYVFPDGLRVTNKARKIEKFGAYEWVNFFENTGETPTEIISELYDADFQAELPQELPPIWGAYFPNPETKTRIYAPTGSNWCANEFYTNIDEMHENSYINHITLNQTKSYKNQGARSSNGNAPFFNIEKCGSGVIFAIGWTGQWNCFITRNENSATIKTKIEDTHFKLLPGEKFRTSSVVVMPYECNHNDSQNKWRRLIKEEFSLIGTPGRPQSGPLCANIWGGVTSEKCLEKIKMLDENNVPIEYVWMDAGWYGDSKPTPDEFQGDWGAHTGNWKVSEKTHPDGLMEVSKAIHATGKKFLLWFEPERVVSKTPIAQSHPEYFIKLNDTNSNLLLNLGNNDAWNYLYETLSQIIEKLQIDFYRNDFNFDPLEYFRKNDAEDRKGITEIKYINGLYKLWDSLLKRFPNLAIDNCASGGRRIDIELLRRSIPLWRSDAQCPANFNIEYSQAHMLNFNTWIPYSGTGSGRGVFDKYRYRSSYGAALATNCTYSQNDNYQKNSPEINWYSDICKEYLSVRDYFTEDFYPLTKPSADLTTWSAAQFNRPEKNDGIVIAFRRENSPMCEAIFELFGIDQEKTYSFKDTDGTISFNISGKELCEKGVTVRLPQKRSSVILIYSASKN